MSSRAYLEGEPVSTCSHYATIKFGLRTSPGGNNREHWRARHRRVKHEREVTAWALASCTRPTLPAVVTLSRHAPSNGLDDDNLRMSLKAVRDQVAAWLGIDDRDPSVRWEYAQDRSPRGQWMVSITFDPKEAL